MPIYFNFDIFIIALLQMKEQVLGTTEEKNIENKNTTYLRKSTPE